MTIIKKKIKYEVLVDDMYHYMDESERYSAGVFNTCEEAKTECIRILVNSLSDLYTPNMSEEKLKSQWWFFGEDPFIRSIDGCKFSATELDVVVKTYISSINSIIK